MSRPGRFAPWQPQAKTRELIAAVNRILKQYNDQLPLSIRQVFYIAVTRSLIGKTEKEYNRLCKCLNRARRATLLPMDSFRDDGFSQRDADGWDSAEHLERSIKQTINRFTLVRQQVQDSRLIDLCEAQGMVPQLERVTHRYSVPVYHFWRKIPSFSHGGISQF